MVSTSVCLIAKALAPAVSHSMESGQGSVVMLGNHFGTLDTFRR